MSELPLAFALAAGLVAAFNPCGFALLPAYLAVLVASDGGSPVWRALRLSTAMTAGFVTVFGLFGLIVTQLAVSIGEWLPWVTIVIGLVLVGLGVWLLTGRELLLRTPRLASGAPTTSMRSMYVYGLSYAVASLSCTAGPFLAATATSLVRGGLLGGLAVFVAFAVGMGLIIGVLSMAFALAQSAVVARLRRVMPYISRLSGGLLVMAGLYVAYYGWYQLRVVGGASTDDPIVDAVGTIQGAVSRWLSGLGAGWVALIFGVLVVAGVVSLLLRRRTTK